MKKRIAMIPVVTILMHKEDPIIQTFDEGMAEAEIAAELAEEHLQENPEEFKTVADLGDFLDCQMSLQLMPTRVLK